MNTIEIKWEMPVGAEGVDEGKDNPLNRALERLLRTGKPFEKLAMCFVQLPESDSTERPLRWLGVFVYTAGERVLFLPGYASMPTSVRGIHGKSRMWDTKKPVDHISLEREKGSWHATTPESKNQFGGPRILELDGQMAVWFGLSIEDSKTLRLVSKTTHIFAEVPATDADRRLDVFRKACEGNNSLIISLHPDVMAMNPDHFFHFSFIVGPPDCPDYTGSEHAFPRESPFLITQLPNDLDKIPCSVYRCPLPPLLDVQISVMMLPGKVYGAWTITSSNAPQTHGSKPVVTP